MAQEGTDFLESKLEHHRIQDQLPPLDSLIQWAQENSPVTKYYEADQESFDLKRKIAKNEWLSTLSVSGTYNYGIFDNLNNQQLQGDPNTSQVLLSTVQSRFNFGAAVNIPLDMIFGRNREIRGAKAELEKSIASSETAMNDIRDLVVTRYYDLIKAYDNLVIANVTLDTYKIAAKRSHIDFRNGVISYEQFNTTQQVYSAGVQSKNERRLDFMRALLHLENLVGVNLNLSDEI